MITHIKSLPVSTRFSNRNDQREFKTNPIPAFGNRNNPEFCPPHVREGNPLGEVLTLETYKDVFVKDGEGYGVSQQQVNQDYTITSVIDDRPPSVLYYELLFGLSPEEIARQPFSTSWYHNVVQVQARSDRSTLQEKINQDENANPLSCSPSSRRTTRKIIPRTDFSGTGIINSCKPACISHYLF